MTVSASYSPAVYTADGVANQFNFSFPAQQVQDVWLLEQDAATGVQVRLFQGGTGLTVSIGSGFVIINDYNERPLAGNKVTVFRRTQATQTVDLDDTVPVSSNAVEGMSDKLTLLAQEAQVFGDDYVDLQQYAASVAQSAADALASEQNAAASESNASTSEGNAAQSAADALASEQNAAASESNASTSEGNAAQAKTDAETAQGLAEAAQLAAEAAQGLAEAAQIGAETAQGLAETAQLGAEAAETGAETALGEIEALYIGVYADDAAANAAHPTRPVGALYFSSNSDNLRLWNGAAWEVVATPSGDFLLRDGSSPMTGELVTRSTDTGEGIVSLIRGPSNAANRDLTLTYQVVSTSPAPAMEVVLAINDAGRIRVGYGPSQGHILFNTSNTTLYSHRLDGLNFRTESTDNSGNLGAAAFRWSTVYAGTGTIDTSDAREKTYVAPLMAAEIEAAKDIAREIGTFQWLASIEDKGDNARYHVGLTVQRAIEIMESHDLDPFAYAFICYDEWDDKFEDETDENGNIVGRRRSLEAGDRYSFRPGQLNLFIARGLEARITALEAALQ